MTSISLQHKLVFLLQNVMFSIDETLIDLTCIQFWSVQSKRKYAGENTPYFVPIYIFFFNLSSLQVSVSAETGTRPESSVTVSAENRVSVGH